MLAFPSCMLYLGILNLFQLGISFTLSNLEYLLMHWVRDADVRGNPCRHLFHFSFSTDSVWYQLEDMKMFGTSVLVKLQIEGKNMFGGLYSLSPDFSSMILNLGSRK